jgi:hypothetical protein
MRDFLKQCGITVHQAKTINDKVVKLGHVCPEFPVAKDAFKKKKKPPSDYRAIRFLGVADASVPFSIFLWYSKEYEDSPDQVCVEVTIDGKKSRGWVLQSGRQNGICIDEISYRPFEFQKLKGSIEAVFWRGLFI